MGMGDKKPKDYTDEDKLLQYKSQDQDASAKKFIKNIFAQEPVNEQSKPEPKQAPEGFRFSNEEDEKARKQARFSALNKLISERNARNGVTNDKDLEAFGLENK